MDCPHSEFTDPDSKGLCKCLACGVKGQRFGQGIFWKEKPPSKIRGTDNKTILVTACPRDN